MVFFLLKNFQEDQDIASWRDLQVDEESNHQEDYWKDSSISNVKETQIEQEFVPQNNN
jgi:hypothetical protein